MRVLYVARAPFVSGAERALVTLWRALDRAQLTPGVVLGHDTDLANHARDLGLPVWRVPLPQRSRWGALSWWQSLRRLRRAIREFGPDLLHANDVPSCQALSVLGRELRIPRVIHVRWTITAADAAWWARAGAESLLCISQWIADQLGPTRGTTLAGAPLHVLPDAVAWVGAPPDAPGATPGRPSPLPSGVSMAEAPPRDGRLTLGFAGQLIPTKGLDLVIEALAQLPPATRPRLLIAGADAQTGGRYRTQLEDLARQRGVTADLTFLGFVRDVDNLLYRQVDAVVCPSREEPLGLVPLEAARWALPALATDVGGFRETIDHGVTGWRVPPDPAALAAQLAQLAHTPRADLARIGRAAHERTQRLYSPQSYRQRLMQIYQTAMQR